MGSLVTESTYPVPSESLFAWHARPGAFARLAPPWQKISLVGKPGELRDGSRVSFDLRRGPLTFRWVAEHRDVVPGRSFTDVQVRGPFESWVHSHQFESHGDASLLRDRVSYSLPGGAFGEKLAGRSVERDLQRVFDYRHRVLGDDLRTHQAYADRPRLRVAITGASGLIGGALRDLLTTGGHEVIELVRSGDDGVRWDPNRGLIDPPALGRVDAVVHLAGENIAGRRWSERQKERIRRSRVVGTNSLVKSLALLPEPPATFISASAIGYYGDRGDEPLREGDAAGEGFLAEVCDEWEQAASAARELGCRVALARFGVVLSPRGGALAKMLPPFRLGAGGRLGSGRQVMSWVSIDDAIGALHHLLMEPEEEGPFNVTAPGPARNVDFTRSLGAALGRPTVLPMPAAAVRLAFGEMADEMLLASARVLPARLEESGYVFRHPTLDGALGHLLGHAVEPS